MLKKITSSAKEIRIAYECTHATWSQWIDPLYKDKTIIKGTKKYTPKQVQAIIKLLGSPY